jgi:hypothetical protein
MRQGATITISAMAILLVAVSTAGASRVRKAPPKCPPKPAKVLVADVHAVVYVGFEYIFGCAYGSQHEYALGSIPYSSSMSSGGVFHEIVAGATVAYVVDRTAGDSVGLDFESDVVVVRDLLTGKTIHKAPTGVAVKPAMLNDVGTGDVWGLVVKSDGAVAWIAPAGEEFGGCAVHAMDKTGSRVLASGQGVVCSSLALAGSRLYWTHNGVAASTVLH